MSNAAAELLGLAGKTALVTGGGAGIGRSIVETYAKLGMRVAVAEIDPAKVADLRAALGPDHIVAQADAADAADMGRVMAEVAQRFGKLHVLVNNVGDHLASKKSFEDSTEAEWDGLYRANLRHMFTTTKLAIPLLKKGAQDGQAGGASIINNSTIEAFRGIPLLVAYGAFKAGITGFTQSLAVELGQFGIRVNAIAPESTNTAQILGTTKVPPENRPHLATWFPIGRFGEPGDCAGAAVYLASENLSGWVSGTTIHIDGGVLASGSWLRMVQGGFTHLPIIEVDGYTPRPHAQTK